MDDRARLEHYLSELDGPDLGFSPLWANLIRRTWADAARRPSQYSIHVARGRSVGNLAEKDQ